MIDEADREREIQRSESEARGIIHDVQKLDTFPEEKKTRWVWELFQNAKDVAGDNGVDIHIRLFQDRLDFRHNGSPFKTKHLLAVLYKTSTKSLNGEGGTTGKYGTGFVTTHLLNRKVNISGVHENDEGKRRFAIEIDRSAANLDENISLKAMEDSLVKSFNAISEEIKKPSENISDNWNIFSYDLKSNFYAEKGISELERNLAFTLLINSNRIRNVTIESPTEKKTYQTHKEITSIEGVNFVFLEGKTGLLYYESENLVFGVPAEKLDGVYNLLPINDQAILFKEFPLIGTEGFNLPVFIQHQHFHPTELRDAIRTKLNSKEDSDPIAQQNRKALIEFIDNYIPFVGKLIAAGIKGTYLFAKSGLPSFIEIYSDQTWFELHVQKPIRDMILEKEIVRTCSGKLKTIAQSKFILSDLSDNEDFFELASKLIPDQIPDSESIWHWKEIVLQDLNQWPEGIEFNVEEMVKLVPSLIDLNTESAFDWLKELYHFLDKNKLLHLGEHYPIYPNEEGEFCLRHEVSIHPDIDEEFKIVSAGLGRSLNKEFLHRRIGTVSGIKSFDLNEFYNQLNKNLIGDLKTDSATNEQIKSILRVCSLFKSDRALKREKWLEIVSQLLPELVSEKKIVSVDYENYWRSAEIWSIKYVCHLIEEVGKPSVFAKNYFQGHEESFFRWLNDFLKYVFELQEESREVILKKAIMPMQNDRFRSNEDFTYAEMDSRYFDDDIKDIYKDYTVKGDPRSYIIDTRVSFENLHSKRRDVSILTLEIDKLFHDENIESKVKKDGPLNKVFLQLNDWYEKFPNANVLLPTFSGKRASLYVLALGEGFSKQIMEIQSYGKSIEDITELAKIQLTTGEMKLFESVVLELGADQILAKAQEMIDAKQQIERWKAIGKVAEVAFQEALSFVEPDFEILNPDKGKDFVVLAKGKEYAIEIKSVEALKGNVNMSILQGETAVIEKDSYALCVLTRPTDNNTVIDKDYFIRESRFVPNIGYKIGNSVQIWNQGIQNLDSSVDVKVVFDSRSESVYINREVWRKGKTFEEFVSILKSYYAQD